MKDIVRFCKLYHASSHVPLSLYNTAGERTCVFSSPPKEIDVNQRILPQLIKSAHPPCIYTTDTFGYYGIIWIPDMDHRLIIGPAYNTPITEEIINGFIQECGLSHDTKEDIAQFLNATPRISYHHFVRIMEFVYYCLFEESLPGETLAATSESSMMPAEISVKATHLTYENKEEQFTHNTYQHEKRILKIIADGKPEMLRRFMAEFIQYEPLREGILANSPLRQAKNIFIGWVTMVGKTAAIEGGLDIEQAYSLIDVYIQECERLSTFEELSLMHYNMLVDFVTRVERCQGNRNISPLTFSCIQYINNHVNEPLQIGDVAQHVGKSRSYLVNIFKTEMGVNMGEYIVRSKLNEAQNLLLYTNKSMSEISNYLCFSSQSYFISVFKKHFSMTPKQYQMKNKML